MATAAAAARTAYSLSGHVVHGGKLGRSLGASREGASDGFHTLNLRFSHPKPAALGIRGERCACTG